MGQKINPRGFRLGITSSPRSVWFAGKDYKDLLKSDFLVRAFLRKKLSNAGLSEINLDRVDNKINISLSVSKPGVVIGKNGTEIDNLRDEISGFTGREINISLVEVKKPELDAQLVADNIALQLEKRMDYRKAMKRAIQAAIKMVEGIKICCSGRLGGAEIARSEWVREGRVPLHTLRANIDYAQAEAKTTYGICGVKVWIFKGEVFDGSSSKSLNALTQASMTRAE